ncbi:MAG: hypothetical protein CML05_03690 [Pseudozobellia sp.]|nr:hypothetical protein [Pseudozobellia sp.]|tara:strand:+ start:1660 stop:2403 length:744 start_codon:yes stop_codon:yes gene_type:complete
MRKILFLLLLANGLWMRAQSPEKISYQAIVRSSDNSLVSNSSVGMRILIRQGNANGTAVYEESHTADTNVNGLVSIEIGTGNKLRGTFNQIPWENGPFFIETQVDPTGGSNYGIIGVSQLLSVPYALYAKYAENITGSDNSNPPPSLTSSILTFENSRNIEAKDPDNTLECTKSATFTLTTNFNDMKIGQTINLEAHNGAVLTVKAGNGVSLNYTLGGSAVFESKEGNVRFGLLRKSGENAYIISGQ